MGGLCRQNPVINAYFPTDLVYLYRPPRLTHLHPSNVIAHCPLGFWTLLHEGYEFGPWSWRNLG